MTAPGRWISVISANILVGPIYFFASKLGLAFATVHPSATPIWPGTGIALAGVLLLGPGIWPAIFLGAFLTNVTTFGNAWTSLAAAGGNTLEAVFGAWLVCRFADGIRAFERPQTVIRFVVLAGLCSTAISATIGLGALELAGAVEQSQFGIAWLTWWIGNMASAVILAPLLVTWGRGFLQSSAVATGNEHLAVREGFQGDEPSSAARSVPNRNSVSANLTQTWIFESLLLFGLLVALNGIEFSRWLPPWISEYPFEYLNVPLLMWAAYRFGLRGTTLAVFVVALMAILRTWYGFGPFARFQTEESMLLLQAVMATAAVGTLVFSSLIVQQKHAAEEVRFQRALLVAQTEASIDGVLVVSRDGRIIFFNRRFAEMWSLPEEVIASRSDARALQAVEKLLVNPLEFYERVRYLYAHPDETSHEEISLKDGRVFERYSAPVRDPEGNDYGRVWQFRDISLRNQAEQALRRSEARYRTLAETSPVGIWQTTAEGYTLYINPAMCDLFEVDGPEEMEGKTYRDFYTPESVVRVQQEHAKRLRGEASRYEVEIIGSRGTRRHLMVHGAPILSADGQVQNFIATLVDITAWKAAERQIHELNQSLEKRVQERTAALQETTDQMEAFCYSISHDLRAPLRAMQGFTAALVEDFGAVLDDAGRDYASRIIEASKRMDRLIQDLLEYSRLGRVELPLTRVSLDDVVADALLQLEPEIRQKKPDLKVSGPMPPVLGHHAVLRQIVINLLTNSLKFMSDGAVPKISISAVSESDRVRLIVQDNGIGIDRDHQDRIFRVFERLHTAEAYPGTGIGLAIVRKGVERMGGTVGVESEPGHGSCFWVELPKG